MTTTNPGAPQRGHVLPAPADDPTVKVDELNHQTRLLRVAIAERARYLLEHLDDKPGRAHVVEMLRKDLARLDALTAEIDVLLDLPRAP